MEKGYIMKEDVRKFYKLYYKAYIKVGKDSELEREALKRWFVIMYCIYFTYVLIRLVHVLNHYSLPYDNRKVFVTIHDILNIFIHFAAFFLPYYAASDLNATHKSYHKKLYDAFWDHQSSISGDEASETTPMLTGGNKLIDKISETTPLLELKSASETTPQISYRDNSSARAQTS
jgi:hypothetical protein